MCVLNLVAPLLELLPDRVDVPLERGAGLTPPSALALLPIGCCYWHARSRPAAWPAPSRPLACSPPPRARACDQLTHSRSFVANSQPLPPRATGLSISSWLSLSEFVIVILALTPDVCSRALTARIPFASMSNVTCHRPRRSNFPRQRRRRRARDGGRTPRSARSPLASGGSRRVRTGRGGGCPVIMHEQLIS